MIKIITGFRDEQYYVINDSEAHKAYYLFTHPDERTVFDNGIALIGRNIQGIEPAYNETMGWNPTHKLDSDDWNEIRSRGIDKKLRSVLTDAKEISLICENNIELLKLPLNMVKNKLLI